MESLVINEVKGSPYYPGVHFNAETGICEMHGESYMEETYKFYEPLITWINEYIKLKKPLAVNFKLTYFNTNSSRLILDILDIVRKYKDSGGAVSVNWYYDKKDPDMIEEVEDFILESGMKINLISY
ncbi:MAG: hypothetical protein A2Y87_12805 [Bacteroidetes bacterium RBG_13_46_8]|nr:MAG: hypothetical protein A2Y87_12805 [Bacteroidetes bacterium RBG_13_46_8]